jgi:hypothetical protein
MFAERRPYTTLLPGLSGRKACPKGQAAKPRRSPAPPAPAGSDGNRLAHLPLVGARRRELTVQDPLAALIPPHERHAVTVGACRAALVLTSLPGAQAVSRGADTGAGDDRELMCPRPLEAAPCHAHRGGRGLEARWATGVARVYGVVRRPAIRP